MVDIATDTLRKVNMIRERAGLSRLNGGELDQLLDWTDIPRAGNLTAACLPRFSEVLGYRVTNNDDGGMVFLCVDTEETAQMLGQAIGGMGQYWVSGGSMSPHDYTGYAILLPDDVVRLATEAGAAVRAAWHSYPHK